jgi:hypothetical protein
MDPDVDPDPSIFIIDLQDANKKLILKKVSIFIIDLQDANKKLIL